MTKVSTLGFFFLFICALPYQFYAQIQLVRYDSIAVSNGNENLTNPWAGGLNSPQFSQIDLNGDGIKDLVLFERDFNGVVKTFLINGSFENIGYTYAPYYRSAFPEMSNWALWVDYNCDDKEDIFTDVPFGAAVYRNDTESGKALKFTKVSSLLKTSAPEGEETLFVATPDIPAIIDVDNDGDKDILVFGILGSTIEYHKNMSMENYGNCDFLEFEVKNRCWGNFSENDNTNGILLFDTCPENVPDPEKEYRHAGSSVLALDLNGDLVKEVILGDLSYNNLVMILNGGTATNASMIEYDSTFPSNSLAADLTVFPASFHLDVNNDAKRDLIVAPNNPVRSKNINNVWYYQNQGSEAVPEFVYQTDQFLQEEMIDVGAGARPVFFDYNDDGLLDLVIGNYGYFIETSVYDSKLTLYQNIGSATEPAYQFITDDYSSISSLQITGAYPSFGDLDNDGVQELLLGDEEGRLHLFKDLSGQGASAEFTLVGPNYSSIDIGETAMPQIVDINLDGIPDLMIGERGGTINYFENTGSLSEPSFNYLPTNDYFGEIDMMLDCCTGYSAPYFSTDSLGNSILYVGSEKGMLYLYNDIDNNLDGAFTLLDSLNLYALKATPAGGDITLDGKEEIVYGEFTGGVSVLQTGTPSFLDISEKLTSEGYMNVYPNPAKSLLNISWDSTNAKVNSTIEMLDVFGKLVMNQEVPPQRRKITLNVSKFHSGIYFLRISSGKQILTKKVLVQ